MRRVLFGIGIIIIVIWIGRAIVSYRSTLQYAEATVRMGDSFVTARIADTSEKRERGLSGTTSLAEDRGMLFVFDEPTKSGFWMNEMKYPIDIIWVHASGQIMDLRLNISPETFPAVFESDSYATYVVEVPGGWVSRHGVNVGTTVNFELAMPAARLSSPKSGRQGVQN